MAPYISLYVMVILLSLGSAYFGKNNDRNKKWFILVVGITYAILCGCRAGSVGYDTENYVNMFKAYSGQTDMWKIYISYLEPGYTLLSNVVIKLGGDIHVLLLTCSTFIVFSALIFIYRYSRSFYYSVFVFLSFPYILSSMDILRFFLGVSVWLWAVKYAIERKPIRYILITLLAAQFHKMIYIFLLFYFLTSIKWGKLAFGIAGSITAIFVFAPTTVTSFVSGLMGRYDAYGSVNAWVGMFSGGIKTAIMYSIVYIIYIIMYRRTVVVETGEDVSRENFFHSSMIILLMSSIAFTNMGLMVRMILAMQPTMAISLGNVFGEYTEEQVEYANAKSFSEVPAMKAIMMVICIFYFGFLMWSNWGNTVPYVPYWME